MALAAGPAGAAATPKGSAPLPPSVDYLPLVTLVRNQDGCGGCGGYAAVAILDVLAERDYPYAPDASYFFNAWAYGTQGMNQLEVLERLGSASEAEFPSSYDAFPCVDGRPPPAPSKAVRQRARAHRIAGYSDPVERPTVEQLKGFLARHGPVFAAGDTPGSPEHGHVFAIVGYDDARRAFTILNSFGDRWGTRGTMEMPYASVVRPPAHGATPRVDWVRWVDGASAEPLDRFTARVRVAHRAGRAHLTVRVGVEGEPPVTVWDRPSRVRNPDDSTQLAFDFALPSYAERHWPPGPGRVWFVEISDDGAGTGPGSAATVGEVTLVERRRGEPPALHRPDRAKRVVPAGGTVRIEVPGAAGAPPRGP
jgi:hypothetical protein